MYYNEFRALGIDAPMKNSGKAKVICPKCEERKGGTKDKDLSINYDIGAYKCHSAKCGWQGYVKKQDYTRPKFNNNTLLPDKAVNFFDSRGISQKTLQKMKITVDQYGNPEFNYFRNAELINVKTRFSKGGKKFFKQVTGAEHIVYNLDSLSGRDKCIFVEGEMDVLSWIEAGISSDYAIVSVDQGAPNPGSSIGAKLECLKNSAHELDEIKEFYICTDKDAPGVYLEQELIRRFGEHRCYIVDLPKGVKDANEVIDRKENIYPHNTNLETLRQCLSNARPVPVSGIKTLDKDQSEILDNFFENGRPPASSTHYIDFDNHFKFLKGDITAVTGIPGHGKSQFLRQLAVIKSFVDGWKWACYVPEDMPFDYFAEDIIKCFVGKNVDKEYTNRMTKEEFEEGKAFVREHFICIYPEPDHQGKIPLPNNEWINQKIRFAKLQYGVNAYIKDPWNQILHQYQGREDEYLSQEFAKEKFFASQFDAAMYVAHPKGQVKNKNGGYDVPDAYSISGGSMWANKFDNIMVVHRPLLHENPRDKVVEVHVKKIKKQRIVGRPGQFEFWFDVASARYMDCTTDQHPMKNKAFGATKVDDDDDIEIPF